MNLSFPNRLASLTSIGCVLAGLAARAEAQSRIAGWGTQVFDSGWNEEPFVEIAAGGVHSLARRADGSVVAWGDNAYPYNECQVPALPTGLLYVEIAAGNRHSLARRSDG